MFSGLTIVGLFSLVEDFVGEIQTHLAAMGHEHRSPYGLEFAPVVLCDQLIPCLGLKTGLHEALSQFCSLNVWTFGP